MFIEISMTQYTASGLVAFKAGANHDNTMPENSWISFISGAEAVINNATRKNWNKTYANLTEEVKFILTDTASSLAGMNAIAFDMSGFTSRGEAESMIVVLRDGAMRNIQFLRDIKTQTFIDGA